MQNKNSRRNYLERNSFNIAVEYVLIFIGFFIFIGFTLISVGAKDEGTLGNNFLFNFLADYLYFTLYPAALFDSILAKMGMNNIQYYLFVVVINAMIYTLFISIILKVYKKYKNMHGLNK